MNRRADTTVSSPVMRKETSAAAIEDHLKVRSIHLTIPLDPAHHSFGSVFVGVFSRHLAVASLLLISCCLLRLGLLVRVRVACSLKVGVS